MLTTMTPQVAHVMGLHYEDDPDCAACARPVTTKSPFRRVSEAVRTNTVAR